jgi:hypothetical protein
MQQVPYEPKYTLSYDEIQMIDAAISKCVVFPSTVQNNMAGL